MYAAKVRLRKSPTVEMKPFRAIDIKQAAEIVRAKYGFDTDQPHKGFVVNHCLPTSTIKEGNK